MDLALTGGTIYDPASGKKGKFDVGFKNGRIAAVQEHINSDAAREFVDVTGKTVVPGLIDLHTHVYHGGTSLGVHPDNLARQAGVTTFVDAGSAGPGHVPASPACARVRSAPRRRKRACRHRKW